MCRICMLCTSGFFFNDSRGLCAGMVESEFHFKQLYLKDLPVYAEKDNKASSAKYTNIFQFKKKKKKKEKAVELISGLKLFYSFQLGILFIVM